MSSQSSHTSCQTQSPSLHYTLPHHSPIHPADCWYLCSAMMGGADHVIQQLMLTHSCQLQVNYHIEQHFGGIKLRQIWQNDLKFAKVNLPTSIWWQNTRVNSLKFHLPLFSQIFALYGKLFGYKNLLCCFCHGMVIICIQKQLEYQIPSYIFKELCTT